MDSVADNCSAVPGLLQTNASSILPQSIMYALTSLVLLGTYAFQAALGRPDGARVKREGVDYFLSTEGPIAINRILCNIGADGCDASGASSGVVIASPSKVNPDCE